jgi:DNA ligase-1
MARLEANGQSLLYTGDFKLRASKSSERCSPVHAETLIMETTYGRPRYVFPPTDQVIESVIQFCRTALSENQTPVLVAYSLGKGQEILASLLEAGLPIQLHGSTAKLTEIYADFGCRFPEWTPLNPHHTHCSAIALSSTFDRAPSDRLTQWLGFGQSFVGHAKQSSPVPAE